MATESFNLPVPAEVIGLLVSAEYKLMVGETADVFDLLKEARQALARMDLHVESINRASNRLHVCASALRHENSDIGSCVADLLEDIGQELEGGAA